MKKLTEAEQIFENITYGATDGVEQIERYARLQIEKDRERVLQRIGANSYWIDEIKEIPITLD